MCRSCCPVCECILVFASFARNFRVMHTSVLFSSAHRPASKQYDRRISYKVWFSVSVVVLRAVSGSVSCRVLFTAGVPQRCGVVAWRRAGFRGIVSGDSRPSRHADPGNHALLTVSVVVVLGASSRQCFPVCRLQCSEFPASVVNSDEDCNSVHRSCFVRL